MRATEDTTRLLTSTVQLKGNVTLARDLRVRVESTYLSAILTDRNSTQVLAP